MINNKPESVSPVNSTADTVEQICEQGCNVVREHIEILSLMQQDPRTHISPSLPTLLMQTAPEQQQEILKELQNIMAVYDDRNCGDNK